MAIVDPLTSLAFSLHSGKGTYALLLGSGVSRSAGIVTGWEVLEDLVRKLAALRGEDPGADPFAWYESAAGEAADYSKVLNALAKSPAERQQILRFYFEPTDDDRERGLKNPTAAHRAIAELVAGGYVRVIVTTNFDRLVEMALEGAGITPTVISSDDSALGALPLTHQRCVLIKPHGDYTDPRIKNTPEELARFGKPMVRLLDQVLDEFGLVVCGWSAAWDVGLTAALERCRSHRFTTYWTVRGQPNIVATRLIAARRAEAMKIENADTFFTSLAERVSALERFAAPHPLSKAVAVEIVKRYIPDERHRVRLHDLVATETEKAFAAISDEEFPVQGGDVPDAATVPARLSRYDAASETLLAMLVNGAYFDSRELYVDYWVRSLERIANPSTQGAGYNVWVKLRHYPALVLMYGLGVAFVATGRYAPLKALLQLPQVRGNDDQQPILLGVTTFSVLDLNFQRQLMSPPNRKTPMSDRLSEAIRPALAGALPDDARFLETFDRFEYMVSLTYADSEERQWTPLGAFSWRNAYYPKSHPSSCVSAEVERLGEGWPPLRAGFFGGSVERLKAAQAVVGEAMKRFSW